MPSKSKSKSKSKSPKNRRLNIFDSDTELKKRLREQALNAKPFIPARVAQHRYDPFGLNILDIARQYSEENKLNRHAKDFIPAEGKKKRKTRRHKRHKKHKIATRSRRPRRTKRANRRK